MYDMKHVGKYNVDFAGETYDEGIPYDTVIIEEFARLNKPTGIKKVFYFRRNRTAAERYVMPDLSTEEKVDYWMVYPNHSKFRLSTRVIIERV